MKRMVDVCNKDLTKNVFKEVLFCAFAEDGAMGEPGSILLYLRSGELIHLNYAFGDVDIKKVEEQFPILAEFRGGLFELGRSVSGEWHYVYLGMGNHLIVHDEVFAPFMEQIGEEAEPSDLNMNWIDIAENVTALSGLKSKKYSIEETMGMSQKEKRYRELVNEVQIKYPAHDERYDGLLRLERCDICEEINLWTYWQGRGHVDTTKVLLVGQDWGCAWGSDDCEALGSVKMMNDGNKVRYMTEENRSVTNHNLRALFAELGYEDIFQTSDENPKNKELFFTNLVTGYRNKGTSGNLKKGFIDEECKQQFRDLVEILEPEIVICLGRYTYEGVLKALQMSDKVILNWNLHIEKRAVEPLTFHDKEQSILIFPVAHCGAMGILNRARGNENSWNQKVGLELQKKDWAAIRRTWQKCK